MAASCPPCRGWPGPCGKTTSIGRPRCMWLLRSCARGLVQPGGFYVVDRGYVDYGLFQELHDVPCSFPGRVKDTAAYEVQEARTLPPTAVQAGVVHAPVLRRW